MKPSIHSEFAPLQKVIIHTPGTEHQQLIPWEGDHVLMGNYPYAYQELQKDHGDLKQFLTAEIGEENVWEIATLLEEVFENRDYRYRFRVLQDILYDMAETYIDHLQARGIKLERYDAKEIVRDLIEGYPRKLTLNNHKLPKIIIPPKRELMWVRDSASIIQCGVIIPSMASPRRKTETPLTRAIFKYHPAFDKGSIFMDMVQLRRQVQEDPAWSGLTDHMILEGGNIMVINEETLAIGVGRYEHMYSNRTTRAAFNLLVEKIFEADVEQKIQRIYMVNVPDLKGFIHLDTVFNMVGPKSAISMPYIFGHPDPIVEISAKAVLQNFITWLRRNIGINRTDLTQLPSKIMFEHAGKCEVYDRDHIKKKGRIERLPQASTYFLDQLIQDDLLDPDRITWIGGPLEDYITPYEHLKVALFEQQNMAGNTFCTAPFRPISYHRNPTTNQALLKKMQSIDPQAFLQTMSSNEIRTDNGGVHCLTMPIARDY
ncbi:MAG: arginine deiminase family protein [Bacteroidota bacterium]